MERGRTAWERLSLSPQGERLAVPTTSTLMSIRCRSRRQAAVQAGVVAVDGAYVSALSMMKMVVWMKPKRVGFNPMTSMDTETMISVLSVTRWLH